MFPPYLSLQKYRKLEFFICYLAKVAQNYSVITVTGFFRYLVIKKLRRKPFFRYYSEFRYLGFRYSSRYLYLFQESDTQISDARGLQPTCGFCCQGQRLHWGSFGGTD